MGRFATRLIATTLFGAVAFGAVAFTGLGAPAVGASAQANEEKFTGVYRVHRSVDGQMWTTDSFTLSGNGTGTDPQNNLLVWSHLGRKLVVYLVDRNETFFLRFDGIRNREGFSSRRIPGTFHGERLRSGALSGEPIDGVWYAVKIRGET